MILIVSDNNDKSTNDIIDWLLHYNAPFLRINDTDTLEVKELSLSNDRTALSLCINGHSTLDIDEVSCVWFRRGDLSFEIQTHQVPENMGNDIENEVHGFLYVQSKFERSYLRQFLLFSAFQRDSINHILNPESNKLINLWLAKSMGIKIPNSSVISNKEKLLAFYNKQEHGIISKLLSPGFSYTPKKFDFSNALTTKVTIDVIDELKTGFLPSLFQELLNKEIELRIFYLNGKFYPSAIFSQMDESTKLDFRNYNEKRPNRTPPFKLPAALATKLRRLMKRLRFNSGSIDIVLTRKQEYVFLEVNPLGQFSQVSYPCNFFLEKQLALTLIQYENKAAQKH